MTSPELAKFLNAGHNVSTPTPFPKTVTEEQELYARGFEDALKTVKSKLSDVPQPVALVSVKREVDHDNDDAGSSVSSSSSSALSTGASPLSPINMEVQESAKLERKRARNREAAARCRKRKLERISNLDERVNELKEENADLASVVKRLRASVCQLKQEVMDHVPTAARSTWWRKSRARWHIEVGEAQDACLPCPHHCGYTVSVPCIGLRGSEGSRRTHLLSPNKLFCQALQPDNSSRRPK